MPPEIPSQFKFEVLLSHTFPGFFSALSAFMLLDVLSPHDLTSLAFGKITDFMSVMGFIIILGTIFGVIIDGIHHWIIEDHIFKKCLEYDKLEKERENLYPSPDIKHFYYFTRIGKDAFNYLTDNYYCYSEFYANIFISLIPFSIISPFYFCRILEMSYLWSIILGFVVPLVLAGLCLVSSYDAFFIYNRHRRDLIYGFLKFTKSIEVTADKRSITVQGSGCSNVTAQLKDGKFDLTRDEIPIFFTTTLGKLDTPKKKTKGGKSTVQLTSNDEAGIAIVTASAAGFISGNVEVEVKKKN